MTPSKSIIVSLLLILVLICLAPYLLESNGPSKEEVAMLKQYAMAGDGMAQIKYGLLFERGAGVKKDLVEAYKWVVLGTQQGLGARKEAKRLANKMSHQQIKEAIDRVNQFKSNPSLIPKVPETPDSGSLAPSEKANEP